VSGCPSRSQRTTTSHTLFIFVSISDMKATGYGTETKVFGEPKLPDGMLARLGRNEGVRRMQTAERKAVIRLAGLRKPHYEPRRARIFDSAAGIEAISAKRAWLQ